MKANVIYRAQDALNGTRGTSAEDTMYAFTIGSPTGWTHYAPSISISQFLQQYEYNFSSYLKACAWEFVEQELLQAITFFGSSKSASVANVMEVSKIDERFSLVVEPLQGSP
ncbi:hypothetical protein CC1G_12135 [Coprinopsis cinerea okayama7|uniref:Uncharacterized protein n=1 Tax=Coprinopsis cinerea (strain Okayama-7 / 130 / ATCC MYA-4618 / FGSC 9003) TaxID=240176 RepID=A8P6X1_COPC7|nr:hypothetical protein CC1G_12135 [Coprinopsis cinerea okayama7\|eukprot:XP_001839244.2 hypothetical protein CC1G_12135 [Coprinopsis cinerea okayama7\